jgi:hypothetical protein
MSHISIFYSHKEFIPIMISTEIAVTQHLSCCKQNRLFSFTVQCETILALGSGAFNCPTLTLSRSFHPMGASYSRRKSSMEFSFLHLIFLDPVLDLHLLPKRTADLREMAGLCPCLTSVHHCPYLLLGPFFIRRDVLSVSNNYRTPFAFQFSKVEFNICMDVCSGLNVHNFIPLFNN